MECESANVDGETLEKVTLEFHYDRLQIGEKTWKLIEIATITGSVNLVTIPREAMGLGDVKFMACVGAFLGWKAVFFTIMAASTIGAVIGLLTIAIGKREWSAKIPFGPYLALGALIWLFTGPQLIDWYFAYVAGMQ
jgi:leader peptidase (prepilin peptidase)/N-methyltransferase